jgi:mRNA interferase RelE/StbE
LEAVTFHLVYHPQVQSDVAALNETLKRRIRTAIENRLAVAPQQYGEPLRKTLKGYWKLRVGDYRVVFKVVGAEVRILGIGHRKQVYDAIAKRTAP